LGLGLSSGGKLVVSCREVRLSFVATSPKMIPNLPAGPAAGMELEDMEGLDVRRFRNGLGN